MSSKCKISLAVVLFFLTSFIAKSNVIINEVMPCDIATHLNPDYNYSGWVEFYNSGEAVVNIKNYTIISFTAKNKEKWTWKVPYDCTIGAGEYKLIYFDEQPPEVAQAPISGHAPYKVDVDGGSLQLIGESGEVLAKFEYPAMYPHVSYGFGSNGKKDFMVPSPKAENEDAFPISERCSTPVFNGTKPGIFSSGSKGSISLACATSGATIHYTTDGSIPTEKSDIYSRPIEFDTTVCIRARAYKEGVIYSPIITGSFIFPKQSQYCPEGKDAPIVSITSAEDNFFGDKLGIYCVGKNGVNGEKSCVGEKANYNQDWQRPINFEYFVNNKQVVSQEAEASIMGGCSRRWDLKSLKLSTNKRTGNKLFNKVDKAGEGYPFFQSESSKANNVYSSLQLRNGGNGAENEGRVKCRDGFMQSIAKRMGNIDYQAYQPVSFYLNGKYMGLMGLRERTNKAFIAANYGYDEDEIDVIEIVNEGYSATCGDTMAYSRMIAFASQNYANEDFLFELNNYMDVEEYINYMIFEQFVVNTDWPGNNCKLWRHRSDGRFRWISFDTDFGLGLYEAGANNYCDVNSDMINWSMGVGNINWANDEDWITILFRSLMKNDDFKQMLLTKYMMHLGTIFQEEEIDAVWDSVVAEVGKEFCKEFAKEYHDVDLDNVGKDMVKFAKNRTNVIYKQLANRYELSETLANLKVSCKNESCAFYINNALVEQNNYTLKCLSGMKVELAAKLPEGYVVKKWKVGSEEYTTSTVNLTVDSDVDVVLYVDECDVVIPNIVINEICSKNTFWEDASGSKPDWIELYNAGDVAVDLAGLYLSDNPLNLLLHKIPSGYSSSVIQPKGHMLLWADDLVGTSPLHVGFKLSDTSGETITLSKVINDSIVILDQVTYKTLGENRSYGRVEDGSKEFAVFETCATGFGGSATPGATNGTIDCDQLLRENSVIINFASEYANAGWMINGSEVDSSTYFAIKQKEITMKPVYPFICQFDYWEVSREYQASEVVLNSSSVWSYFYSDTIPSDDWFVLGYDDSEWSTGYGRFGYSNDSRSYNTKLDYGKNDTLKYITAYFRTQFDVDNLEKTDSLKLTLTYDDAAIVYVNGVEISRYNITSDSVSYNTLANSYIDDKTVSIYVSKSLLKETGNVLAVEIHQSGPTSSDMTFSMDAERNYMTNIIRTEELTFVPKNDLTFNLHLIFNEEPTASDIYLSAKEPGCGFIVNDHVINTLEDTLSCMTGDKISLSPIVPEGYMFDCWDINGTLVYEENTNYVQIKSTVVKLKVKKIVLPSLVINEISIANKSVKNDLNKISNWVEIYNRENSIISLSNIYISNSSSSLLMHKLSGDIKENGYMVYWADKASVVSHLPFEIKEGDVLYLSAFINKKEYLLDSVICKPHVADGSYGRTSDGGDLWTAFAFCIDDLTTEATPNAQNGSIDCATEIKKNEVEVTIVANYPDLIYDVNGKVVEADDNVLKFITYKGKEVSIEPISDMYKFSHWGESKIIGQYLDTIWLFDEKTEWSIFYDSISPAEGWNAIGFNDSTWMKGFGKIGYGDVNYDTYLDYGKDSTKKYPKAYFRYEFDLNNIDSVDYVGGNIMIDDGVVMYINEKEFVRVNQEKGRDYANDAKEDEIISFSIDKKNLKVGKNVIAVEISQCSGTSSDMTFAADAKVHIRKDKYSNTIDTEVPAVFVAENDTTILLTMDTIEPGETGISNMVGSDTIANYLSIYPNPATDFAVIEVEGENSFNYIISDLYGRIIEEGYCNSHKKCLDLSNITPGVYIVEVIGNTVKHQGKLIKK